jgi:hypothetical protein
VETEPRASAVEQVVPWVFAGLYVVLVAGLLQ